MQQIDSEKLPFLGYYAQEVLYTRALILDESDSGALLIGKQVREFLRAGRGGVFVRIADPLPIEPPP